MGVLAEILGDRGIIDMGVRREATVEEVLNNHRRRRRHRGASLQDIEKELGNLLRSRVIQSWTKICGAGPRGLSKNSLPWRLGS